MYDVYKDKVVATKKRYTVIEDIGVVPDDGGVGVGAVELLVGSTVGTFGNAFIATIIF